MGEGEMTESPLSHMARIVGYITMIVAGIFLVAYVLFALEEGVAGGSRDAKCQDFAEVSGGEARDLNTFGDCWVEFENGMRVDGRGIRR